MGLTEFTAPPRDEMENRSTWLTRWSGWRSTRARPKPGRDEGLLRKWIKEAGNRVLWSRTD